MEETQSPTVEWLEANTAHADSEVDDATEFAYYRTYTTPEGAQYRRRLAGFLKVNPFASPGSSATDPASGDIEIEQDGARRVVDVSTLERRTGVADTVTDFSCWVEHRLPGIEQPVKRSAFTAIKRPPMAGAAAGGPA